MNTFKRLLDKQLFFVVFMFSIFRGYLVIYINDFFRIPE